MITDLSTPVAVIPIFVNAGAALVPTLVAGFTSVLAILLKPKELFTLFRRKPWPVVAVFLAVVGIAWAIAHIASAPAQAASRQNGRDRSAPVASTYPKEYWTDLAFRLLAAETAIGVKPIWTYVPDATAMVLSSPAYADKTQRVYTTAAIQDVASMYGVLSAVDANTGRDLWRAEKAGDEDLKAFFSSPALTADQKSIVVGQGLHEDDNCSLLCFNADTGELRWKVPTPLHIESSPAVRGDLTVAGAGAIEDASHKPKSHAGYVLAVQISTGKELWRHDLPDPESSPAIAPDGSTVYIGAGFNGNAVVALRTESDEHLRARHLRRELWRTAAPYPITGPVTISNDVILVGGGNSDFVYADPKPAGIVLALDRQTGAIRWQAAMDDAVLSRIVVSGGRAFCPVRNGRVVALDLGTGKPVWKQAVHDRSPLKAGLAMSNDGATLFAASSDGHLVLLNAADGKAIETHPLNDPAKPGEKGLTLSTPTFAADKLFVGTETGGLRAFQTVSPKPK